MEISSRIQERVLSLYLYCASAGRDIIISSGAELMQSIIFKRTRLCATLNVC